MVRAGGDVKHACAGIPRQMVVAFAVGVVGEDVAKRMEVNVVGIAETVREDLAGLAVG